WDTTKSGKHAYDYLTTYNRTVSSADPCAGIAGCGSPTTFAIPTDTHDPKVQVAGNFTCFNCTISTVAAPTLAELGSCSTYNADAHYALCGDYTGDSSTAIKLTFTTSVATPVIAWGGHIASELIWGEGQGAGAIPGSPYHQRLISIDGNGGNQDRSLKASAVLQPPAIATQVSSSGIVTGQSVTDTATLTGSKGVVTGTVTFFLCGPTVSATPCTTGGTPFGPVTLSGGQATSPAMSPSAPGTYCLRLEYIPDATALYSEGQSTSTTNECFTVIQVPSIEVLKDPDSQSTVSGNTVTFTIKVTNTGDTTLTNVHVTDAQAPDCARTAAEIAADRGSSTFAPGATYTYTCTSLVLTAPLDNVATACGDPPFGDQVCDDDHGKVGLEHLSSYQDFVPNDFGELSVEGSTVALNGDLTFALYKGNCTAQNQLFTETADVTGVGQYGTTNTKTLTDLIGSNNTDGTYNWKLTYSGDTNGNADINGACGTENFAITNGADAV
ncbi:MAG: hypothetical protein ACJ77A_03710, partial [Actinomycetota bacterium]